MGIIKVFYLPTDAQEKCFKKNIKIYIATALTLFWFNHHQQGAHYSNNTLPDDGD